MAKRIGEEELYPGDLVLYNLPYGTSSHAQDAAIVIPVFLDDGKTLLKSMAEGALGLLRCTGRTTRPNNLSPPFHRLFESCRHHHVGRCRRAT
ncbi:MAG: hypothetical protein ACI9SC_001920 [Gammaproteobacteria bacterium]|jgi:hypothetical protein